VVTTLPIVGMQALKGSVSRRRHTVEEIDRAKAILERTGATDIASAGEEAVGAAPSNRDAKRI